MIGPGAPGDWSTLHPPARSKPRVAHPGRLAGLAAAGVAVLALVTLAAVPAARAAGSRRLGVVKFHGPAEGVVRVTVMRAAKANHFVVIGGKQIERTARRLKVKLDSDSSFQTVARALGLTALVTGEVTRRSVKLTVRSGDGGAVVDEASWAAPERRKLAAAVGRTFWKRLGPAIEKATPPRGAKLDEAAEGEPVAESPDDSSMGAETDTEPDGGAPAHAAGARTKPPLGGHAPATDESARKRPVPSEIAPEADREEGEAEDRPGSRPARPAAAEGQRVEPLDEAFSFAVGPRFGMRSLSYVDDRFAMNSAYSLSKAPIVGAEADFFPGALSSRGPLGSLGVTGSFSYLLPIVKSKFLTSDRYYTTQGVSWSFGLKVRLPVGFYLTAAVGNRFYQVVDDATAPTDVPTTNYQFVRGGGGLRSRLSPTLFFMAHGAYLHCLKVGPIGDAGYFPNATAAGFEAGAAFGYLVSPRVELRAGVDVQRFALDFHMKLADYLNGARTAGGAIDQYSEAWLAVAFVLAPGASQPTPTASSRAPAE